MRRTAAVAAACLLAAGGLQSSAAQSTPQFEVASVKRSASNAPGFTLTPVGGRFVATNVPLRFLVMAAFGIPEYRLDGGPGWINSERYDIQATPTSQWPQRLRALLVDRFKLTTHTERRSMQGFALVLARSDGRLGERLRRSDARCETSQTPAEPRPFNPTTLPPCGQAVGSDHSLRMNTLPFASFANELTQRVGAPVEDRTGLAGNFVIELDWAPNRPGAAAPGDDGVVLFTALQEQLGLRLQRERVDVEVVVIDRVERPTGD
jgi:uncharacterized protein (TIGR03435 family)